MSRPATVTIDLAALQHNFKQIKHYAPHAKVIAMVKSNAYGHGLQRIALALPAADALGVACIEEGMLLRQAGIKQSIVLLEGLFNSNELSIAIAEEFTLVVHHPAQIDMLEKKSEGQVSVWLKIDTGMHRLGFAPAEVEKNYQRLMQCAAVRKPIGLMTHLLMQIHLIKPRHLNKSLYSIKPQ